MKTIKILGIAVASLGVVASVGGAIALYTKEANKAEFTIGAGTHTDTSGSVQYKINNAVNPTVTPKYLTAGDEEGTGLDATHTQVKYEFDLSATYSTGVTPAYTVGNLGISLTNVPEAYRGHLAVWASIEGYGNNTLGKYYYAHTFMHSDYQITGEAQTFEETRDVAVASVGVQKLVIYLKYSNISNDDLYAKDEGGLGYTLTVTWAKPSDDFDAAYIVSNKTAFEEDDAYMMAPNAGYDDYAGYKDEEGSHAGTWQWMGAVKGADDLTTAKCRQNNVWSSGDNFTLTKDTVYDVYWYGNGESEASFDARS